MCSMAQISPMFYPHLAFTRARSKNPRENIGQQRAVSKETQQQQQQQQQKKKKNDEGLHLTSDEAAISWPYSRVEEFMTPQPQCLHEKDHLTSQKVISFLGKYHGKNYKYLVVLCI